MKAQTLVMLLAWSVKHMSIKWVESKSNSSLAQNVEFERGADVGTRLRRRTPTVKRRD